MSATDLEGTLEEGILTSEQLRVTIVATLVGALLVSAIISFATVPGEVGIAPGLMWLFLGVQSLFLVHELIILAVIRRCRRLRQLPWHGLRYSTMVVETSLPTIGLAFAAMVIAPETVLAYPMMLAYFLFITASTLRMDFALSLSTGVVAGLGYGGLAAWLVRDHAVVLLSPLDLPRSELYFARSMMMVICGLVSGLVGLELRKRLRQTISQVAERARVTELFGQHVSPAVVEKLLLTGAGHDSELRKVCVMFVDIRGFTAFSEQRTPREVVDYLNRLFSVSIDAVNRNHGIVNKFLGDGFMAVFGAPLSEGLDCRNALRAAREVVAQLERLVAEGAVPATKVGIGLHFGAAMTGNIGSAARKEYTIIGDVVNLASRVEALNKEHGSTILATGPVVAEAGDDAAGAVDLGEVEVRGRADPIRLFRFA